MLIRGQTKIKHYDKICYNINKCSLWASAASAVRKLKMSPNHLLVEVGHHLLKDNISGLICFAKLLQDLQRTQEDTVIDLVTHFISVAILDL